MKKGDIYKVKGKELFYQFVCYWGGDLVLLQWVKKKIKCKFIALRN